MPTFSHRYKGNYRQQGFPHMGGQSVNGDLWGDIDLMGDLTLINFIIN